MSEKRFVLCKKGEKEYIEDNGCVQIYGFDVVCELLNALNDENEQLKKQYAYVCQKLAEPIDLANLKYKDLVGRPTITRKELFGDE